MKKFFTALGLLSLLCVPTALAFLDELDSLEQELNSIEEGDAEESIDINALLDTLDGIAEDDIQFEDQIVFTDVPDDAWYAPYVAAVAQLGIVSGYKDEQGNLTGLYGPGDPVTIAQVIKIALEAAGYNVATCSTQKPSTTGSVGHWAERYIACAEQNRIRILQDNINIDRPALRGEVVGIVHDAYGDSVTDEQSPFTDTADHTYEADIAFASMEGMISGDTDTEGNLTGTFRPDDGVNRAEAAKIIFEKLRIEEL